mgnify:CR=1 FL=1
MVPKLSSSCSFYFLLILASFTKFSINFVTHAENHRHRDKHYEILRLATRYIDMILRERPDELMNEVKM